MGDSSYDYFIRTSEMDLLVESIRYCISERSMIFLLTSLRQRRDGKLLPSFPSLFANDTKLYCSKRGNDVYIDVHGGMNMPGRRGLVRIFREYGMVDVDCVRELVDWSLLFGILVKSGSHYYFKDKSLGQGINAAYLWAEEYYGEIAPLFTKES